MPSRGRLPDLPEPTGGVPVLFLHGVLGAPGNFEAPIKMLIDAQIPVLAPAYGRRATAPIEQSLA